MFVVQNVFVVHLTISPSPFLLFRFLKGVKLIAYKLYL